MNHASLLLQVHTPLMSDGDPCSILATFPCCMRVLGLGKGDWIETESKATFSY